MLELYTDRLKIRSLQQEDWQSFLSVHQDPRQNQYVRVPDGLEVLTDKFEQRLRPWRYESGDWLTLVIEEISTGEFIGFTGLYSVDLSLGQVEVGYMLAATGQGKGYGTESLKGVIDWACLSFDVHKFIGLCADQNQASIRVLEKCGFTHEGTLRHNYLLDGRWIDDRYYGLLASERS
ncbi:GNAT family N-acetyltransferase [Shewanella psychrotolerans]|uniref:GNAT family N-acetyltransferase n=1 Tax=Shewanella psychrotolerans TaxID=2864206 RepID=UPI001C65F8FF|nr:GNAT family protein [Shewanella psychrotolerans]QYK02657.1 GNAT family N-acetyltransferase [Shewanella psychrotolerans]